MYIPKQFYARLEKYREPNKPITTAVQKVLDMVEGNNILVVVVQRGKIRCNKMKRSQPNRIFCKILGTIVSPDYCREKCLAAPIVKEVLEDSKSKEATGVASLEKFFCHRILNILDTHRGANKTLNGLVGNSVVFLDFCMLFKNGGCV